MTRTVVVPIRGIDGSSAAHLCEKVRAVLTDEGVVLLICDVSEVEADLGAVDLLARLNLMAKQEGCGVRFLAARPELLDLLDLAGLGEILRSCDPLLLEAVREAEQGEEPRGVEKERDPDDLST